MSRNREFENSENQPQGFQPNRSDANPWEKYMPDSEVDFSSDGSTFDDWDPESSEREFCSGNIDSLVWERLVDSQLPEGQYEELLSSMEQQPELYRDCAMAFLERQAWTEAMQEMGLKASADPLPRTESRESDFLPSNDDKIGTSSASIASNTSADAAAAKVAGDRYDDRDRKDQENNVGRSNGWLKSSIVWIPSSIAALALLTIGLPWLQGPSTDSQAIDPAPRVRLADFNKDAVESYVQSVNQLSVDQKNHVLRNKPSHGVSTTVPTTPAIFRQRQVESSRRFLIMRDGVGNCFALPVDSYKSEPLVVQ